MLLLGGEPAFERDLGLAVPPVVLHGHGEERGEHLGRVHFVGRELSRLRIAEIERSHRLVAEAERQDEACPESRHAKRVVLASLAALDVAAHHRPLGAEHLAGEPAGRMRPPRADEVGRQAGGGRDRQAVRTRSHAERGHRHPGEPAGSLTGPREHGVELTVQMHVADEHLELTKSRRVSAGDLHELPVSESGAHAIRDDEEEQHLLV